MKWEIPFVRIKWLERSNYASFVSRQWHRNMAVIKRSRSRGYKPESCPGDVQLGTLRTGLVRGIYFIFFMDKAEECFGLLLLLLPAMLLHIIRKLGRRRQHKQLSR